VFPELQGPLIKRSPPTNKTDERNRDLRGKTAKSPAKQGSLRKKNQGTDIPTAAPRRPQNNAAGKGKKSRGSDRGRVKPVQRSKIRGYITIRPAKANLNQPSNGGSHFSQGRIPNKQRTSQK